MARLIFPPGPKQGFTSDTTSRHEASPYHVIRELLQNCLDGARDAGRRAEIDFTIDEVSPSEIPGIDDYREAFRRAREGRGEIQRTLGQSASNHETVVIDAIDEQLSQQSIPVLACVDNGVGLDDNRLMALLAEGDTTKARASTQGRLGSWGVGHLAAFAASDLRYVLYAGKSARGGPRAAGQAILASHQGDGTICGAEGFWVERYEDMRLDGKHEFVVDVPQVLNRYLETVPSTGTVVQIPGFNWFRIDRRSSVVDEMARVAALNFLAALETDEMRVTIRDHVHDRVETVDYDHLSAIIAGIAHERNAKARGQWSGSRASRGLQTLRDGRRLEGVLADDPGVEIWFRAVSREESARSSVHVFRDGMWITDGPLRMEPGNFDGVNPFDSVLSLRQPVTGTSEIYELVREAEGAEHRDLRQKEIKGRDRQQRFADLLTEIAKALREAAGEISADDSFTPEGFAQIEGSIIKSAADLPPLRPRSQTGDGPTITPTTDGKRSRRRRRNDQTPDEPAGVRPGRAVRMRRSIRGEADSHGAIQRIRVLCQIAAESPSVGLRVRRDRGSDETCDLPYAPEWLKIKIVETDGGEAISPDQHGREALIPASLRDFTIVLAEPVADMIGLELDVVARRGGTGGKTT